MKLFSSIIKLTGDIFEVVEAPIRMTLDTTRVVIAPIKTMVNVVADETEKMADELERDLK
jgi:hypothetical protein